MIVSLTSYPQRFPTLHLTLRSLLTQSVRPDRLILWIAEADLPALPETVRSLEHEGLDIRGCDDLRSFKKILPTLAGYPEADIVTADDDLYFWSDWLQELLIASRRFPEDVVAHRLHRIASDENGLHPYREWTKKTRDQTQDWRNFATGGMGALYPAGSLHPDVLRQEVFMKLCPDADDVWLYWMVRLNGRFARHSGTRHELVSWPESQAESLWKRNRNGNDAQIDAMVKTYGLP